MLRKDFGFFILGLVIAVPALALAKFAKYFHSTFLNSSHGGDNSEVNFFQWLNYILKDYFSAPLILNLLLLSTIAICILLIINEWWKSSNKLQYFINSEPLAIIIIGFSFCAPIMLFIHRLWGMYLHTGTVLLLLGCFMIYEKFFVANNILFWRGSSASTSAQFINIKKLYQLLFILTLSTLFYQAKSTFDQYYDLAHRTQLPVYQEKIQEYQSIISLIEKLSAQKERTINVAIDPNIFMLNNDNKIYSSERFWGPFADWEKRYDIIFITNNNFNNMQNTSPTSNEYQSNLLAWDKYLKYVINCHGELCYKEYKVVGLNKVKIFIPK